MKKLLPIGLVLVALYFGIDQSRTSSVIDKGADQILASAFESRRSSFQIEGEGTVTRILADDSDGSRHQRFIIGLDSGQTVLVAHNVDLAPRVADIETGDRVQFNGEYEWNSEGGVIHWTHHDPEGRHTPGWIKHRGKTYQ